MSDEAIGGPNEASSALFTAALAAADRSGMADELLSRQIELTELQIADLKREDRIRHWSLRVRHISDVMKLAFEVSGAIILIALVVFLVSAIWNASHDNGLVIDAFNVPSEMATRGLTGQVVAAQLQDKLAALQDATNSARPAESYTNNWGDDIKVEIPDTGVSIGEFYRYLAGWLGNQTHINGEVFRTEGGIAITVRSGDAAATVIGKESDFDTLLQQAAEKIYEHTQPYRYAVFLPVTDQASIDRGVAIFQRLAATGSLQDKIWSHTGLSTLYGNLDPLLAPDEQRKSLALNPDFTMAYINLGQYELALGHDEAALQYQERAVELLRYNNGEIAARAWTISKPANEGTLATMHCDFGTALDRYRVAMEFPDYAGLQEFSREQVVLLLTALHESSAASRARDAWPAANDPPTLGQRSGAEITRMFLRGDWAGLLAARAGVEASVEHLATVPGFTQRATDAILTRQVWPNMIIAIAETGDTAGAAALANKTPLDCFACLRARARVAAASKDWPRAEAWFKRVTDYAPSIPWGWYDWGRALMAKGDLDGAMAKLDMAHDKAPHWADPLEAIGEALLAQKNADDAADKFEQAAEFAPRWGRLHLKWGEALLADGDSDGANKQFALAATLDLTQAEQAELARLRAPALRQPR